MYEKALLVALRDKSMQVVAQAPIDVQFRGKTVGQFYADLLVEEAIIVEVKAVTARAPEHKAQVINYLKASNIEVGLLVNFRNPKLEYRRLQN